MQRCGSHVGVASRPREIQRSRVDEASGDLHDDDMSTTGRSLFLVSALAIAGACSDAAIESSKNTEDHGAGGGGSSKAGSGGGISNAGSAGSMMSIATEGAGGASPEAGIIGDGA